MLHYLRNSYRKNNTEMREIRLQAADEFERLYTIEKKLKDYVEEMISCEKSLDKDKLFVQM